MRQSRRSTRQTARRDHDVAGRLGYAADQVGYVATGAKFIASEIQVKLPNPARVAGEVGRIGISVQLWSSNTVVDFSAFACTDTTCRPGGKPVAHKYRLDISVYNRKTQALICSTTATAAKQRCSDAFPSWNRVRLRPGSTQLMEVEYDRSQGLILASANALNVAVSVTHPGSFDQARITVQFGRTPFSKAPFDHPRKTTLLWTIGTYFAEFVLANGHGGYIGSSLFSHHKLDMTWNGKAGHHEAAPTGLSHYGAYFSVYLYR